MIRAQSVSFLLALAAGSGIALAQASRTLLNLQVSTDGVNWSNELFANPNEGALRVLVRASVSWSSTTTTVPVGFSSLTWQPVIAGMRSTDTLAPFANVGNNTNGGGVDLDTSPLDGPFGRLRPFAATGPSGLQSYAAHHHSNGSGEAPTGEYLRIARNDITRWMGTGPTLGTGAVNNFNGAGGLACVQKAFPTRGSADPEYTFGITDIAIFQFALDFAQLNPGENRVVGVTAPLAGTSRDATTGVRRAMWFANTTESFASLSGELSVTGAAIHLVPTPAALSLLAAGGLIAAGRRRNPRQS